MSAIDVVPALAHEAFATTLFKLYSQVAPTPAQKGP
jgi:hypothetical protein